MAGFAESGGAAALIGDSGATSVGYSDLGVRLTHDFTLGDRMATARGMLSWRRAFGDTVPLSDLSFSEEDAFAIAGAPIEKDTAVEAGPDLHLADNAKLGLAYDGQFGSSAARHGATVGLSIKF